MLKQVIHDDVPVEEREVTLQAMSDYQTTKSIKKYFDLEEMTAKRKDLADYSIIIKKAEEKLDIARAIYNGEVKEPLKQSEYLTAQLESGYQEVDQQVYLFVDHETGMMGTYDNKGELLESRKLTPEERQTKIK